MKSSVSLQSIRVAPDLATSAVVTGDRMIYEVRTGNSLYRERLLHIGFQEVGEGIFSRALSVWGDVAATHRRFASHLRDMLLQSARMVSIDWQGALRLVLGRLHGRPLDWFLYGSAALAVRGIDVSPGDLDFWVDDADMAGHVFADLLVEPVTTMKGWVAEKGGRAYAGCIFEWVSDVHPTSDPHEQGADALSRVEHVAWDGL